MVGGRSIVGTFKRILLATDLSSASSAAFDQAVALAKRDGSELLIAHAYEEARLAELGYAPAQAYQEWDGELRSKCGEALGSLVALARERGAEAKPVALRGFPEEAIVEAAAAQHADLIVMGTHGRRGAARLLLGSVASRVIATAPCPVLTVRSVAPEAANQPVEG